MKADIFIPSSGRLKSLENCLASLLKQKVQGFRVILVDIKKNKFVENLIVKYNKLNILYLVQNNKGLVKAANLALKHAKNPIFIRIDDDVITSTNWLKQILSVYKNSQVGGVTGPTFIPHKRLNARDLTAFQEKMKNGGILSKLLYTIYQNIIFENKIREVSTFFRSGAFSLGANYKESSKLQKLKKINNLEAANWSCRLKLLKEIGGFDILYENGLGDYHEADAALKIKRMGYELIFNPRAVVIHNISVDNLGTARPDAHGRMHNFIVFYLRFFKIKNLDQLFRFLAYTTVQIVYYFYKFITTGKINQLGAFSGVITGFLKSIKIKKYYEG